ncbi:salicylate hydroxylase [Labrys miyagiensis]|uniref:Salicylate hydroxylase n=1 Tax=Labrys miyagiensis TaxID=346912 RepID=A0ABQ6CTW3_9HYPH|nr:FAD-dependent monooxygenase [Labrys miyagiensis]GLS23816.1 salicylate hydroxylase [Labrys miyagiensis]
MTIAIAGAGIGGLTAALALHRRGFEVAVYERAAELEAAGAGIQLTPNALHVLFGLGLRRALEKTMVRLDAVVIRQAATGKLIQRLPLDICERRWGAPYGVIHRADLQAVLLDAVRQQGIPLALGHEVGGVAQDKTGVRISFASGQPAVEARLLIGADGLWSFVRNSLGPNEPPRFAGKRAWRAVLPLRRVPDFFHGKATGLWLGERTHFVHYPVFAGEALNLVAITHDRDDSSGWSKPQPPQALLSHFQGWDARVHALLAGIADWRTWPLYEGRPGASMAHGRIALLGDAAHPMLPFLAQGGGAAIEDAAELAGQLATPGDDSARLEAWSALRLPRVRRIQTEAHANGERYHWRWPLSTARDLGLSALGGRRMLERYDWLYGWKPSETA